MAGQSGKTQEPVADPEAGLPTVDKIRIILTETDVSQIEKGKLVKVSGVKAELFLPTGQRGVPSPDEQFFGKSVGEVLQFLATEAADRSIPEWGNRLRAGSPAETNGK